MPGRSFVGANGYRYGFNGKEKTDEVSGNGNDYDYGFRIYNPRLGRFLSVDPLFKGYPWLTPYQFAGNSPILNIDLDGLEIFNINASPTYHHAKSPVIGIVVDASIINSSYNNIAIIAHKTFPETAQKIQNFITITKPSAQANNLVISLEQFQVSTKEEVIDLNGTKYLKQTITTKSTKIMLDGADATMKLETSIKGLLSGELADVDIKLTSKISKIVEKNTKVVTETKIIDEDLGKNTITLSTKDYLTTENVSTMNVYDSKQEISKKVETLSMEFKDKIKSSLKENTTTLSKGVKAMTEAVSGESVNKILE